MGVMLLVLTPCLYCNVSDSWMLPNKWHRAAIGAAGMWVEIVIASIATFVWWFTEPGLLNYICLSIMFVSSVSTIVFNGNPLLRYDGYYILSDLMEVPNLRQKANSILFQKLGQWCLGLTQPPDPFLPQRNQWLFALYTVASTIYRWVVLISILFFLHKVFEPYGLQIIGKLLVLVTLYGLVLHPLYKLYKYFSVPGRLYQVKKAKLYGTMAVCGLLLGLLFIPLPYHVTCPVEIEPRDATTVYAEVPGVIEEVFIEPGDRVEAGAELARLSNLDVDYQIARLEGRREVNLARYNSLLQYERHNSDLAMREQEVV
ncbi:MAG: hemolysin D, partial [Pirellulales bacterium]